MTGALKNSSWLAKLALKYRKTKTKTVLAERHHVGPLIVQKPFYPEKEVCHTYLIHPPGGIVGGDRIELTVELECGSNVLMTTPAANKFYQSKGPIAELRQKFVVADHACFEYLPQENIIFNGAKLNQETEIHLSARSQLMIWDMFCLGRTASGEIFQHGYFNQSIQIYRGRQLIHIERNKVLGDEGVYQALNGYQANPVFGTFFITPVDRKILNELGSLLSSDSVDEKMFSYTLKGTELICRFLGKDVRDIHTLFRKAWALLRPSFNNRVGCEPRIWHT